MEFKRIIGLILLIALVFFLVGTIFYENSKTQTSSSKITVAVTIPSEEEFVKAVGGDKVNVLVMVPSNADPHTYEPSSSQLQQAEQAQMYAEVGSGLEFEIGWMDKIKGLNSNMEVVNCSQGIDLMQSTDPDEGNEDPHVWNSPRNAKIMVQNICDGLVKIDPANKDYYTKNRDEYLQKLDVLDKNMTTTFANVTNKNIMVYHPSWGYLCRDYGLNQISIENEGKEATPATISRLVDLAGQDNVKVIFVAPQFSNESAQTIANQIGGQVVSIDPMAENYIENMYKITQVISKAQETQ